MTERRESFSASPPLSDLSLADDADVTKQRLKHTTNLHTKPRLSTIQILEVEQNYKELWNAIQEIPRELILPSINGLYLQGKFYLGVKRRGKDYVLNWLDENHIHISHKAMLILECLVFYHEFVTWDRLFEYLKTHDWGQLEPDRSRGPLDGHPSLSKEEELRDRPRQTERKKIQEVDVIFYGTRNKISNAQAYKHFFDLGYEII